MERIELKDFLNYSYFSSLKVSPSGKVAYVKTQANEKDNNYVHYIYYEKGDKHLRLTSGGQERLFTWYDEEIVFAASRSQEEKSLSEKLIPETTFYKISLEAGEAEACFTLPYQVLDIKYLGKGMFLFVAPTDILYPDWHLKNESEKAEILEELASEKDYEVIEEVPWWSNGGSFTSNKRRSLFIYELETKKIIQLSKNTFSVSGYDQKEDEILFYGIDYQGKSNFMTILNSVSLKDYKQTELLTLKSSKFEARYYQDGIIIFATQMQEYGLNENPNLYFLDKEGNLKLKEVLDKCVGNAVGSDVRYGTLNHLSVLEDKIYFLSTVRNSCYLMLTENFKTKPLIELEGSVEGFVLKDNRLLYVGLHSMLPQELFEYDLSTKITKQLTNFNHHQLQNKYLAKPELIQIQSQGYEIDGWVLKPYAYDSNKKYPAILDIHGGPKTAYGEVYYHEMQYWSSLGYFVFFCNPCGSEGRGNKFADIRGVYGTIDYQQIMDFTDAVLAKYPSIDENKVGVTGGSYGGFMTNWIIGHTDRFVAAATQRSIANWLSFMGNSDIGLYFTRDQQKSEHPYTDFKSLMERSPLTYFHQAKTPTLVIHSDADYRCWIPEGLQVFSALKDLGVDTKMVWFKGENHELSRSGLPKHRVRRLDEITSWMDKYTERK